MRARVRPPPCVCVCVPPVCTNMATGKSLAAIYRPKNIRFINCNSSNKLQNRFPRQCNDCSRNFVTLAGAVNQWNVNLTKCKVFCSACSFSNYIILSLFARLLACSALKFLSFSSLRTILQHKRSLRVFIFYHRS